jgi:hypothetical protein
MGRGIRGGGQRNRATTSYELKKKRLRTEKGMISREFPGSTSQGQKFLAGGQRAAKLHGYGYAYRYRKDTDTRIRRFPKKTRYVDTFNIKNKIKNKINGTRTHYIQEIKQQELTTLLKYNGERKMRCGGLGRGAKKSCRMQHPTN